MMHPLRPIAHVRPVSGSAWLLWAAFSMWAPAQAQTTFVPNETLVSPQRDLVDLEFSQSRKLFTWADSTGAIWTGKVDAATGKFTPRNGKGTLVDATGMSVADLAVTFNGPEWVGTSTGDQIVYTKFPADQPHTAANGRLATATTADAGVSWTVAKLNPDVARISPYASEDSGDARPRISYTSTTGKHYWRELSSATEVAVPNLPNSIKSVRFVRGHRSMIYTNDVNGISQVFWYTLDDGKVAQMTRDNAQKDLQTVPWMWRAPEFSNKLVFMTVADNQVIRFYRNYDPDGDGVSSWSVFHSITLPANSKIASPEPFVYKNKSYVMMAMTTVPNEFPSSIWVANINPAAPLMRKVSDDSLLRVRTDPEVFITTQGPFIYYNRYDPAVNPEKPYCADCSEGVYRATTGL